MKYLHTMVRVTDLDASLEFYCNHLGLREIRRRDSTSGRFTLVFLAAPGDAEAVPGRRVTDIPDAYIVIFPTRGQQPTAFAHLPLPGFGRTDRAGHF